MPGLIRKSTICAQRTSESLHFLIYSFKVGLIMLQKYKNGSAEKAFSIQAFTARIPLFRQTVQALLRLAYCGSGMHRARILTTIFFQVCVMSWWASNLCVSNSLIPFTSQANRNWSGSYRVMFSVFSLFGVDGRHQCRHASFDRKSLSDHYQVDTINYRDCVFNRLQIIPRWCTPPVGGPSYCVVESKHILRLITQIQ